MIGRYLCKCPKLYPYDTADLWPEAPLYSASLALLGLRHLRQLWHIRWICDALESLRVLNHHIALSKERWRGKGEVDEAVFRIQSINRIPKWMAPRDVFPLDMTSNTEYFASERMRAATCCTGS